MRHINGVYTQHFNRGHKKEGQLFRGRYKAVLVDADNHLLEVLRYIHRNPLKAGIVKTLGDYNWSSHHGYMSRVKKWSWLHTDELFAMLTPVKKRQRSAYIYFVSKEEWYTEERVRKHLRKRHKLRCQGEGYKRFPTDYLYRRLGLYKIPTNAKWKQAQALTISQNRISRYCNPVTSRGNAWGDIFLANLDRQVLFDVLAGTIEKYNCLCHAFFLLDNHYHAIVETPDPNYLLACGN